MTEKTLILVIGCHRSGTSAVAGALAKMGIDLGKNLLPPSFDNPKGFFESRTAVTAHDFLLSSVGAAWDRPPESTALYPQEAIAIAVDSLARLVLSLRGPVCAVKDPRATLYVPIWRSICEALDVRLRVLYVYRRLASIRESLCARQGWDRDRADALIDAYREAGEKAQAENVSSVIAFPDHILERSHWRRVFDELGIEFTPNMLAVRNSVERRLIHHLGARL